MGRRGGFARGSAVTPSDSTIVNANSLWVGGTGDLVIIFIEDYDPAQPTANSVTIEAVPAGAFLPMRVAKVLAATSATEIVALY